MNLNFLFIVGRPSNSKYNVFGKYPYVQCNNCIHGIVYDLAYSCAHPNLSNHIYPSCFTHTNIHKAWKKLCN